MMELRPPDLDNLALHRIACLGCKGKGTTAAGMKCHDCRGRGETHAPTGRGSLSNTSIGVQLSCLRKYGFEYVDRLEQIRRPLPLTMGAAFQKALELGSPTAGASTLDRDPEDEGDAATLSIQQAIVEAASRAYMDRYGPQDNVLNAEGGDVLDEYEYLIRLRNPETGAYSRTFDLHGFADRVIDHGTWLELVENKFVGSIDKLTYKKVKLDRQVGLECYALWRATGKPVRQIRYRLTRKPSIKVKQKETTEEFIARLHADYGERPDFYLHEEEARRSPDDLLQLEAELWDWADQRRKAADRGFYSRNTGSCHEYGGCAFIDLCVGDPDAIHLFRQRPPKATNIED